MICHMICSLDGRILQSRWRPESYKPGDLFEDLHDRIGGDAWIVGRVTGQEFAKGNRYPDTDESFPANTGSLAARPMHSASCWTNGARSSGDAAISAVIRSSSC
ncbi:hypothetical protein P0F65_02775 [Sphingomonas sp. I4]